MIAPTPKREARRAAAWLAAPVAFAVAAAPVAAARQIREWPIEVAAPGLTEVELDAAALAALTDAGGVVVLDGAGAAVPAARRERDAGTSCRSVEVRGLERSHDRWRLRLHVPGGNFRHDLLRFELDSVGLGADCRLVSVGPDGRSELARGDLFRIGEAEGLAGSRLVYPPTEATELELDWPAEAGFPTVRAVEVCAPATGDEGPWLAAGELRSERLGARQMRFRAPRPALSVPVSALEIELATAPAEAVGYRLRAAGAGGWRELGRGLWPGGQGRLRFELGSLRSDERALLFDLHVSAPDRATARWRAVPQRVRFEARAAGVHRLRIPGRRGEAPSSGGEAAVVDLGASVAAPGEPSAATLGATVPAVGFAARWPVLTAAKAGEPIALAIEDPVRALARPDLADLRLISAGRWVPSRIEAAGEAASRQRLAAVAPQPDGDGTSVVELDLSAATLGRAPHLLLRAPVEAAPFEREVRVRLRTTVAGREETRPLGSATWRCADGEAVPCELALPLPARAEGRLRLELSDGDSAPLSALDLERIGDGDRLVALWPGGEVDLAAGARELDPPRFDLAPLEVALELSAPTPARLGPASEPALAPWYERHARWLLVAAVVLAASGLLVLLRRLVVAGAPPEQPG